MRTIFSDLDLPWPYNIYLDLFYIFIIGVIGFPTVYALFFGAPWVPTPWIAIHRIIKEANIKKGTVVYELGCGDARLTTEAAKLEAKAIGYEISPLIYIAALCRNLINGWNSKIYFASFWNKDLSNADVIFLYLLPKSMNKLAIKLKKELKANTLVISYAFPIKNLCLEKKIEKTKVHNICPIWIYKI